MPISGIFSNGAGFPNYAALSKKKAAENPNRDDVFTSAADQLEASTEPVPEHGGIATPMRRSEHAAAEYELPQDLVDLLRAATNVRA